MLFLARLFTNAKSEARSKSAHQAEIERLKREIRETVTVDPEHAARTARAILARLGVET